MWRGNPGTRTPSACVFPPLLPAAAARGASATCGPRGEVRAIPEKVGRRGRFASPRGLGAEVGGRLRIQHSPHRRDNSPALFMLTVSIYPPPRPANV